MKPGLPRIAIVDDEECVLRALERLLRSAGMDVATYQGGRKFIASLPSAPPHCLVLDLHMPGFSGFEVMEILPEGIPVIAITGHDFSEIQARAHRASILLPKPVDDLALLDAIQSLTTHHP